MNRALALAPLAPWGCKDCAFLKPCGGLESQQAMFGCFGGGCGPCGVQDGKCDYACPKKPDFWRDWAELGGLDPRQRRDLPSPTAELPMYVPMIRHGWSRHDDLPFDFYGINTFEAVDSLCRPRDDSGGSLRRRFKIAADAAVLMISVNKDPFVEKFWRYRDPSRLAALADLGVVGITTPNFSFFDDAPRLHSLRNLWRIVRCAEELADAGVPPVLHLNALTAEDWTKWEQILLGAPGVRVVCKEFQTGLWDPGRAMLALDEMARLQDRVGRDLHPIVVGGRRFAFAFAERFARFTIVDSVPFIATMKRHRIVLTGTSVMQVCSPTRRGEALDDLLQDNIRTYMRFVEVSASRESVDARALAEFDREDGSMSSTAA